MGIVKWAKQFAGSAAAVLGDPEVKRLRGENRELLGLVEESNKIHQLLLEGQEELLRGAGQVARDRDYQIYEANVTIAGLLMVSGGAATISKDVVETASTGEYGFDFDHTDDGVTITLRAGPSDADLQREAEFENDLE